MKSYFGTWWKSILTLLITVGIYLLGLYVLNSKLISDHFHWVIFGAIFLVLISIVYQFFLKKWYLGILQIAVLYIILRIIAFSLILYPYDFFADKLEIPSHIDFEKPIKLGVYGYNSGEDSLLRFKKDNLTFVLANYFQPGMYKYYVWYKPLELGSIYVKAYEVTKNTKLSSSRLKNRSRILITKINNNIEIYNKEFTIYEGDWGKPYGSRIELWFEPKNGNPEYKILEKNYIIEGWMR